MIERVYLKNHLSFDEVELTFNEVELNLSNGLMIFTGPSGAGKSVLLQGILSIFGYFEVNANLAEAIVDEQILLDEYGIEIDNEIIFKAIKKEKTRFFINNQAVSKKTAKNIAKNFIDYLSLRNADEFEEENLLKIIDKFANNNLDKFQILYEKYILLKKELEIIEQKEKKSEELKEFLRFEIEKITQINPKENEFEELMEIKKSLSKIEKIKQLSFEVSKIFDYENSVNEFLEMINIDSGFFDETMNELRNYLEDGEEKISVLEGIDVEEILDRLEKLQSLIKRFGNIQEALLYRDKKEEELKIIENLSFEKVELIDKIKKIENELSEIAQEISKNRKNGIKIFENKLNYFLDKLYMPNAIFFISETSLNKYGIDSIKMEINNVDIGSISTGEFNRVRLAFLASKIEYENKTKSLFLDEIDANLSGEESMSVAEVLKFLAKKYQIFAISHQPQLTSKADKHFFVGKNNNKSFVKELDMQERIDEIARIISGKELKKEAKDYAKQLLKDNNG